MLSVTSSGVSEIWLLTPQNHPSSKIGDPDRRCEVVVAWSEATVHMELAEPHVDCRSPTVGGSAKSLAESLRLEERGNLGHKSSKNRSGTSLPYTIGCLSRLICI